MVPVKIAKKIVGYSVAQPEEKKSRPELAAEVSPDSNVVRMHEKLERPELLRGTTYKVKPPIEEHAMYVTINEDDYALRASRAKAGSDAGKGMV